MARWFLDRSATRGIPSVALRRLLPEADFLGCRDLEVSGLSADSRKIEPGQVFVAVRGDRFDGHDYVRLAVERGAVAVIVERECPEAGTPQVVVGDARAARAKIAHALAGSPSESMAVFGIVGTKGKTATAAFLRAILERAGLRVGAIDSLGWSDGVNGYPPRPSAPDAPSLALMLGAMADRGCGAAVVSLPAETLRDRSASGIAFASVIVTGADDATRPDLARIVRQVVPGGSVIVPEDDATAELLGASNLVASRVGFALGSPADVSGSASYRGLDGSRIRLSGLDDADRFADLRPIGDDAARAAVAASAAAKSRGISAETIVAGLESVVRLAGRLEPIVEGSEIPAFTDRSPDGFRLAEALETLRSLGTAEGRIHCILAADPGLDPKTIAGLVRSAETLADRLVLTLSLAATDAHALDAYQNLMKRPGRVRVIPDRSEAIEAAIALARPGDALLIAGDAPRPWPISRVRTPTSRRLSA